MGINDFSGLNSDDLAGSCNSEPERVGNVQQDWHKTDTAALPNRSGRFTYFVRAGDAIKIGSSAKPEDRLAGLQVGSAEQLETLLVVPFSIIKEEDAHRLLSHLRIRGEWFRAEDELLDMIDDIRNAHRKAQGRAELKLRRRVKIDLAARDTSDLYRNLLAAMAGAKALAKLRPDLKFICADIVTNATLQMREPDEPDYKKAGNALAAEIDRRMSAHSGRGS